MRNVVVPLLSIAALAACAPGGPNGGTVANRAGARAPSTSEGVAEPSSSSRATQVGGGTYRPPSSSPATRNTAIVPGRPARVFIFAGVDEACRPLAEPQLTVAKSPAKGEISFRPGQPTTIAASGGGTCIGAKATGTGVYYTARAGTAGADSFSVTAKLAGGESMTRDFRVEIAE